LIYSVLTPAGILSKHLDHSHDYGQTLSFFAGLALRIKMALTTF